MPSPSWRWILLAVSASAWLFALYWFINAWQANQPYNNAIYASLAGLASLIGCIVNRPHDSGSISSPSGPRNEAVISSPNISSRNGGTSIGIIQGGQFKIENVYGPNKPSPPTYQPPEPPQADMLPEHDKLPIGSRLPFLKNAVFTGRQEDLRKLADALLYSSKKAVGIVQPAAMASGSGGIGKTQLAIEFCYRYGRFFHGVHWIQADQSIEEEIARCGEKMGLPDWPEKIPEQKAVTLKAWREGGPRLVVLDNIEGPQMIKKWMPELPQARLLFTSRKTDWPVDIGMKVRYLDVLPLSESMVLLRKLAPRLENVPDKELEIVAKRLGRLPLALDLAGRYLHQRPQLSPASYLEELAGSSLKHPSLSNWAKHSPTDHATSLADTFASSWNKLNNGKIDALARLALRACGYCAPNIPIPQELLALALKCSDEDLDRAMIRLSDWGLVIPTDEGPALHPLIAEFARMQDKDAEESILPALAETMVTLTTQALESRLPERMSSLREHLDTVAQAAERAELQATGSLWSNLGMHLAEHLAEYKGARNYTERALKINEKVYGPDHPNVAIRVNNLGWVLQDLGDLDGARKCYERALKIDEKVYGPDHPRVAIRVNNLGLVLRDQGDLGEARKCFERALKIDEKVYGPDHPRVAIRVNNLGSVLEDQGDLDEARKCFERALKIYEKAFGPDHPDVATMVNNLGGVLKAQGDLDGARKCFERALKIDEKVYGPDHPSVARDANNLGLVLQEQGDLGEARKCYERALKIDEKVYGPDHSSTRTIRGNLESLNAEK